MFTGIWKSRISILSSLAYDLVYEKILRYTSNLSLNNLKVQGYYHKLKNIE